MRLFKGERKQNSVLQESGCSEMPWGAVLLLVLLVSRAPAALSHIIVV